MKAHSHFKHVQVLEQLLVPVIQKLRAGCVETVFIDMPFWSSVTAACPTMQPAQRSTQTLLHVLMQMAGAPTTETDASRAAHVGIRSLSFQLLASMYEVLPNDTIKSRVVKAFAGDAAAANQLTSSLCRTAAAVIYLALPPSGDALYHGELHLRRSAYLCLSSVICRTQVKLKFYEKFLFTEDTLQGQLLWSQLVDCSAVVQLPVVTNFAKVKTSLSALATAIPPPISTRRQRRARARALEGASQGISQRDALLGSMYASSTLSSQDVLEGSSMSSQSQSPSGLDAHLAAETVQATAEPDTEATGDSLEQDMEVDQLNDNPVMMAMLRTIQTMVNKFTTSWVDEAAASATAVAPSSPPAWMRNMIAKLQERDTHINVRLFIAKVMMNCAEVFHSWVRARLTLMIVLDARLGGSLLGAVDAAMPRYGGSSWYVLKP